MTDSRVNSGEESGKTSSTLLRRVQAQDPEAWKRFVHLYSPLIYRWCRQAGLQQADASDVGQEVFRSVLRSIADFRHDRDGDSLRGWLRTITQNKVRDFRRRQPPGGAGVGGSDAQARLHELADADLPGSSAGSDSAKSYGKDEDDVRLLYRRAVDMVLADCQEQTREAFLRVMRGQSPADVAADLKMSVNAVYLAKSRVLHRIREEFAGLVKL